MYSELSTDRERASERGAKQVPHDGRLGHGTTRREEFGANTQNHLQSSVLPVFDDIKAMVVTNNEWLPSSVQDKDYRRIDIVALNCSSISCVT